MQLATSHGAFLHRLADWGVQAKLDEVVLWDVWSLSRRDRHFVDVRDGADLLTDVRLCEGFRTTALQGRRHRHGAVVGKPPVKEPADCVLRRRNALYGDCAECRARKRTDDGAMMLVASFEAVVGSPGDGCHWGSSIMRTP